MNSFFKKMLVACFLHVLFYSAESNSPQTITVVVNALVTLRFNGSCEGAVEWKYRQMTAPQTLSDSTLVAHLDQGTGRLTPAERFKDRVKRGDLDLDLSITTVVFNDNGWYECYCNSKQISQDVMLVVLVSFEKAAHVGENVTLTCHGLTGNQTADIYWEKDGETVLKVKAGHFFFGHGFKDRASVSLSGSQHGDHSVTITDLCPSDQGVYQCFFSTATDRLRQRGRPDSFNLTVSPKVEEKQPEEAVTCSIYIVGLAVSVGIIFLVGICFLCLSRKKICSKCQRCYRPELRSRPQHETERAITMIPEEHQESPADPNDEGCNEMLEQGVNDPRGTG